MTLTEEGLRRRAVALVLAAYEGQALAIAPASLRVSHFAWFQWSGASSRIDVSSGDTPKFVPFPSDFVRAYRLWLSPAGEVVRGEPIYSDQHLGGAPRAQLPQERQGFFPGNAHFRRPLEHVDALLRGCGPLRVEEQQLDLGGGLDFLRQVGGEILQDPNGDLRVSFFASPFRRVEVVVGAQGVLSAAAEPRCPPLLI